MKNNNLAKVICIIIAMLMMMPSMPGNLVSAGTKSTASETVSYKADEIYTDFTIKSTNNHSEVQALWKDDTSLYVALTVLYSKKVDSVRYIDSDKIATTVTGSAISSLYNTINLVIDGPNDFNKSVDDKHYFVIAEFENTLFENDFDIQISISNGKGHEFGDNDKDDDEEIIGGDDEDKDDEEIIDEDDEDKDDEEVIDEDDEDKDDEEIVDGDDEDKDDEEIIDGDDEDKDDEEVIDENKNDNDIVDEGNAEIIADNDIDNDNDNGGRSSSGGGTIIEELAIPLANLEKSDHFAYVIGYPEGDARPLKNITREEVAVIFYRLLTDESRAELLSDENTFADLGNHEWSRRAISTLSNAGILKGYPDGTFRPSNPITRAEFATVAAKFDSLDLSNESKFNDISDHWAESYITSSEIKGWISGYPDLTFKPEQDITRAEAMTLINNVLGRKVPKENIHPEAMFWQDISSDDWYYEAVMEATNSHDYIYEEDSDELWTGLKANKVWP